MRPDLAEIIQDLTGRRVAALRPLAGGCIGEVLLVLLADGGRLVAKLGPGLEPEAWMLRFLAERSALPVPTVIHGDDSLVLMHHVESGDPLDESAQADAARVLAGLHAITWHSYGLERDTVIGGLPQANPPTARWLDFFRDHRLLDMGRRAQDRGRLPSTVMDRIERLAARLDDLIDEPERPGLVHGDGWGGNILCHNGRVTAFIDPALSFSDPEIELAFGTMFSTFGPTFYHAYDEIRPIRPGFWDARKDIYTLWPLLVHIRLFGGGYLAAADRILKRFVG